MNKWDGFKIILMIVLVITLLIIIGCTLAEYGNKPVSEMPVWMWWLLK